MSLRFAKAMTIVAALSALAGCAAKIRDVPAPVPVGEDFRATGQSQLSVEWWRDFDDPVLDALMEEALTENFTLGSAWARLSQAQAQARVASADLFPTLNANAQAEQSWTREKVTETTPASTSESGEETPASTKTEFKITNVDEYSAGLVAEYELDLWGRVRSLRNASLLDVVASAEDLRAAAVTLTASVASTWYQLQEQEGQLRLLQRQVDTTSSTLQIIDARFRRGLTPASDVLQQQQLLESRFEELHRAEAQADSLKIALAILLGRSPGNRLIESSGELISLPALPATGVPSEIIGNRPDVRSAYTAVQAADQRIAAAIANQYPRFSLSGSFNSTNVEWKDLFDNWFASIAANIAAPIFDGGARRAEVAQSRARTLELFNDYGQTLIEAVGEVEEALGNEHQQRLIVESIERQLAIAKQVTERIGAEYLGGTSGYLRVLDAQISRQSLERELLTARRELIGYRIDLCRALSSGWELEAPESPEFIANRKTVYPLPIPLPGDV